MTATEYAKGGPITTPADQTDFTRMLLAACSPCRWNVLVARRVHVTDLLRRLNEDQEGGGCAPGADPSPDAKVRPKTGPRATPLPRGRHCPRPPTRHDATLSANHQRQEQTPMSDDILDRAKAALQGITEGPWGTDGELIASGLTQPSRGVTDYLHGIANMNTDDYDEEDGVGEYDGQTYRPYEQMIADAKFIAESRTLVEELVDAVEQLRRGGAQLGKIIDRQCRDVLDMTGLHDLIGEDGDGDWALVWEKLAELVEAGKARPTEVD